MKGSSVVLQPFNPDYEELVLSGEELEQYERLREKIGSIICREILDNPPSDPNPTPRTAEFYKTRPCVRMVMTAAGILDDYIAEHPVGTPAKPDME